MKTASANPLVSILIPCWGCREYIGETIQSALAQTYEPIEVIVVEDCGNDGTYEVALSIKDDRLRVFRNPVNRGQYGNKNQALAHARGVLIKYLDGDDLLEPHCTSTLVEAWRAGGKGTGIVFGRFVIIDKRGRSVAKPRRWGVTGRVSGMAVLDIVTRKRLAASMFGNVTPHLFERGCLEKIGGFPDDGAGPGDIETFFKLLTITDVFFTESVVASYRSHSGGSSARTFGLRECSDYVCMVEKLKDFFASCPEVPAHLKDEEFLRDWMVWAGAHNIMASFQRKLRRMPNQYEAIRLMYCDRGLSERFHLFVRNNFPPYVSGTLASKIRRLLDLPQHGPLFDSKDVRLLLKETA